MNGRRQIFANIPPATKGLLLINIAMLIITELLFMTKTADIRGSLSLYYFDSEFFRPYQIITHMFMHANFWHLFFNMYALWLFGQIIERNWGSKKFLIYYFVTGLGAAILQTTVNYFQIHALADTMTIEQINKVLTEGSKLYSEGKNWIDPKLGGYNAMLNSSVLGASGAVMGVLLAFGMLYPNVELRLLFIPAPIKAKYFVIGYAVLELFMGVSNFQWDNIAHYAHLGGMLFGLIFILIWGKGGSSGGNFYKQY